MKILLDECVPQDLCKYVAHHECHAARHVSFDGKENGALPSATESEGFQVLLTVDKIIPHQQNFDGRAIALIILDCKSNNLRHLLTLVPACLRALDSIAPGEIVRIQAD